MGYAKPRKKIINCLHRAKGQLVKVESMFLENRPVLDIVLQLMAVKGALESIQCKTIENFLNEEIIRLKKAEHELIPQDAEWLQSLTSLQKKLFGQPKKEIKKVVQLLLQNDPRYQRR
ncbi:MAG: metal-sensing transcriptional repressor [Chitinophagales bacterium]